MVRSGIWQKLASTPPKAVNVLRLFIVLRALRPDTNSLAPTREKRGRIRPTEAPTSSTSLRSSFIITAATKSPAVCARLAQVADSQP